MKIFTIFLSLIVLLFSLFMFFQFSQLQKKVALVTSQQNEELKNLNLINGQCLSWIMSHEE